MIVDTSHGSEALALDAVGMSRAPLSVNHTAAKALYNTKRAIGEEVIRKVAERGGYVGVVAYGPFLGQRPTLDDFADHVGHVARVGGIDCVGIGTDTGHPHQAPSFTDLPGFPWQGIVKRKCRLSWTAIRRSQTGQRSP